MLAWPRAQRHLLNPSYAYASSRMLRGGADGEALPGASLRALDVALPGTRAKTKGKVDHDVVYVRFLHTSTPQTQRSPAAWPTD